MKTILGRCPALLTLALICSVYALADGKADFKMRCAPCHGPTGTGDTKLGQNLHVPDLCSSDVQNKSDADLTTLISKGKGRMPAYERKLNAAQIAEVVKFIRMIKR